MPRRPQVPAKAKLDPAAKYAVLATVLPDALARQLTGYSPDNHNEIVAARPYGVDVQELRKRLSDMPNFVSYADMLLFFDRVMHDENVDMTNRKDAAKAIVKMQGYDAPAKMEIENRHNLVASVGFLKQLIGSGLNPQLIAQEKQRRLEVKAEFTDISNGEDLI